MSERASGTETPRARRRSGGGRAARVAQSSEKPKEAAVRAGLIGGAYRPLTDHDIQRIHERAAEKLRELMSSHYPEYIDPNVADALRKRYPIKLTAEDVKSDCGRW